MLGEPALSERVRLVADIASSFLIAKDHSHVISTYPKAVENALLLIEEVEKQLAASNAKS